MEIIIYISIGSKINFIMWLRCKEVFVVGKNGVCVCDVGLI